MTAPHVSSPESLDDLLPPEAVAGQVDAADWRAAVRAAGDLLVLTGSTTPAYTDQMIAALDRNGPYVVITPGFALAHAAPSSDVLRNGMSFVQLAHPVRFGHPANDPVQLIAGACQQRRADPTWDPSCSWPTSCPARARWRGCEKPLAVEELRHLIGLRPVTGPAAQTTGHDGRRTIGAPTRGMDR